MSPASSVTERIFRYFEKDGLIAQNARIFVFLKMILHHFGAEKIEKLDASSRGELFFSLETPTRIRIP